MKDVIPAFFKFATQPEVLPTVCDICTSFAENLSTELADVLAAALQNEQEFGKLYKNFILSKPERKPELSLFLYVFCEFCYQNSYAKANYMRGESYPIYRYEMSLERLERKLADVDEDYVYGIITSKEAEAEREKLNKYKFKAIERMVIQKHPNVISCVRYDEAGNGVLYRTRASWAQGGRISNKSYDNLIMILYKHYYEGGLTLQNAFSEWLKKREESGAIEYLTASHYRADFKKYVMCDEIANKSISSIKKSELLMFYERTVGDAKITRRCFGNIKSCINGAFTYANTLDEIECIDPRKLNTHDIANRCKTVNNSDDVYTEEDRTKLLSYLEGFEKQTVYSLAIRLMFCLPIRIGELLAITWDSIDWENSTVTLDHSMVTKKTDKANREFVRVDYMKHRSESGKRVLGLSNYAVKVLKELEKINGDKTFVLQSSGNMPISENNFNAHLKKCCEAVEIPYRSSHKIRFYACSHMYAKGVDENVIQACMGHASLTMTRHYDRRARKPMSTELTNEIFGR